MTGWEEYYEHQAKTAPSPVEAVGYYIEGQPISMSVVNAMIQDIAVKLELSRQHTFLEVGCGAGLLLSMLKEKVAKGVGCDLSFSMIQRAENWLPDVPWCVAEAGCLPFPSQFFDRVLCYSVFLCFPDEEYAKKTICELMRVTKPGGKILIGDLSDPDRLEAYHREKEKMGITKKSAGQKNGQPQMSRLKYLNLSPSFFEQNIPALGNHLAFKILPQSIHGKITSVFRYDVGIDVHAH